MIDKIRKFSRQGLNMSQIALVLGVSRNTVRKYLSYEDGVCHLSHPFVAPWADKVDWNDVKAKTNDGVKLSHYWEQFVIGFCDVTYISFWREFKRRFPEIPIDLHKIYEPGQRCEFDFKGIDKDLGYYNRTTGEFMTCRLFGNILCFSQLFFARFCHSEKQGEMLDALARSFEYFGGIPEVTGFDNAKAQVMRADKFDADLNPEFSYFCEIYATAPIPARPRSPKDKNLIENALGVFCRWAYPQLKRQKFYSLQELNTAVKALCDQFNERIQRKYGLSRRQKFLASEVTRLKPLPETTYVQGEWRKHKPHADCHIQYKYNFYSVPYECRGAEVDVRISGQCIEIYQDLKRVAIHQLQSSGCHGRYITNREHLPPHHLALMESTPQYVKEEAEAIGPNTHHVIERLIDEPSHPLMYLRRCQGLLRFKKRYSAYQLEQAMDFFREISLADIKLSNVERVIQLNRPERPSPKRIQRTQTENLRGQHHWADIYH